MGGIGWQEEGAIETLARHRTIDVLQRRVDELNQQNRYVRIVITPADVSQAAIHIKPLAAPKPISTFEDLTISYLTPVFFTDLLVSPSIPLALAIGSKVERRWTTSNDKLFLHLFHTAPPPSLEHVSLPHRLAARGCQSLLTSQMTWGLSFATAPLAPLPTIPAHHPLYDTPSISLWWTLFLHVCILRLGVWVFGLTGARFVQGRETWGEWARWNEYATGHSGSATAQVEYGSVLRVDTKDKRI